ncbi:hypothetical protein EVG20_g5779 [Dentipellis fragilis]|uniref:Uncharacterized protein n=1 Tax=Dentipellis fragilis TaxID=205917 RepID=A0A4Y9YTB7_9AGAM|nr:hypothetical protein EVG20_g5779 [Dentipellis fragilis]
MGFDGTHGLASERLRTGGAEATDSLTLDAGIVASLREEGSLCGRRQKLTVPGRCRQHRNPSMLFRGCEGVKKAVVYYRDEVIPRREAAAMMGEEICITRGLALDDDLSCMPPNFGLRESRDSQKTRAQGFFLQEDDLIALFCILRLWQCIVLRRSSACFQHSQRNGRQAAAMIIID